MTGPVAVVGGGIVGLAVAARILAARPGAGLDLFEKETTVGAHQTGHNSGVLHAGLYYRPGSLKADLCRRGGEALRVFCAERSIPVLDVGKVVVARHASELDGLARIESRARANGVPGLARLDAATLARTEPHATGIAALHSPRTAIVDFAEVARALAADVATGGGRVLLGRKVEAVRRDGAGWRVVLAGDRQGGRYAAVVVCAGLGTDQVSGAGRRAALRIVPFRGQYHRLAPRAEHLVKGLIYPVPDPRLPFLGIHLTRHAGGGVLVGPNAVLATALEGYRWSDFDAAVASLAGWPGLWRLARRHWRTGVRELATALSVHAFAAAARTYVPGIADDDLGPAPAGVRAQAVDRSGGLVDDFAVDSADGLVVVRNAPSPAATSSLAIAEHLAALVPR
ncbi:MAG: L-2-hydroxyglutarate oxidase [Acidimicrobiales bacterium]